MSAEAPKRSGEQPAAEAGGSFARGISRVGRLLKHSDFERVYKQGRRHFSSHMTVFYLRQAEKDSPASRLPDRGARVGLTVGKMLGGAVQRNRIKRRLREAVQQRRMVLNGAGAVDHRDRRRPSARRPVYRGNRRGRVPYHHSRRFPGRIHRYLALWTIPVLRRFRVRGASPNHPRGSGGGHQPGTAGSGNLGRCDARANLPRSRQLPRRPAEPRARQRHRT